MTARESMIGLLEKQRSDAGQPPDLAEWRTSLSCLYARISEWLAEPVARRLLRVDERSVSIREPRLGEYQVRALKVVTPRGDAVNIQPRARDAAGTYGRVDMDSLPAQCLLVRRDMPDHWQIAAFDSAQGAWSFRDLTEESFFAELRSLLGYPSGTASVA